MEMCAHQNKVAEVACYRCERILMVCPIYGGGGSGLAFTKKKKKWTGKELSLAFNAELQAI